MEKLNNISKVTYERWNQDLDSGSLGLESMLLTIKLHLPIRLRYRASDSKPA